jgi:HEAT repeat protein
VERLAPAVASVLTWEQWWKRHGDIYTFVSKPDERITGERGIQTLSPARTRLLESLLANLKDDYFDVRAASAIALGKMGINSRRIRTALLKAVRDKKSDVRESALLALGMIRAVEASRHVAVILTQKRNETSVRCFAAVALGLMKDPANTAILQNVFTAPDTKEEVKAGALLGLGLLGDQRAAYTLYPVFTSNYKEELQALAVTALAKIGTTEVVFRHGRKSVTVDLVTLFERKLTNKQTRTEVRRSIAMALGTIGRQDSSVRALQLAVRADRDKGVKAFALLSLARIRKDEATAMVVHDTLRRVLAAEKDAVVKGFAALAVGLSGDREGGKVLLGVFKDKGRADVRAAAAIGLGLLKYKPALPDLGEEVQNPADGGRARGYAAIALGMIGEPASSDFLKSVLGNVNIPYLKWASATGLALLGDRSAVPTILAQLDDGNRITRESAIRSLAHFREDTTIAPLLEQFSKEDSDEVRTMIAVTLGKIADVSETIPVLRRIGRNVNWVAAKNMKAVDLLTRLF